MHNMKKFSWNKGKTLWHLTFTVVTAGDGHIFLIIMLLDILRFTWIHLDGLLSIALNTYPPSRKRHVLGSASPYHIRIAYPSMVPSGSHAVFLTVGWLFGRISQKGQHKKRSGQTILWPNFGWFWTKRGWILTKLFPSSYPFYFWGSVQEIFLFAHSQTKIVFFLSPNSFKKGKLPGGPNFFFSGRIFLLDWLKSSAKSWQHWSHVSECSICLNLVSQNSLTPH